MNVSELKTLLSRDPGASLRLTLPGGRMVPVDFHVTEVGHSAKKFVDCGGTVRFSEACVLQVWRTDDDKGHRLNAGKLAAILELSGKVIPSDQGDPRSARIHAGHKAHGLPRSRGMRHWRGGLLRPGLQLTLVP